MKLAVICFSVLTGLSLWFGVQGTPPVVCRGKPLPITLLPGPKMTFSPTMPLRFGGTRELPRPPITGFRTEKGFRLVIKTQDEFTDFWKRSIVSFQPSSEIPPPPLVDFSKDMVVVSAMGERPTSGYMTIIDGACEVDGHVEVFVSNVENVRCGGVAPVLTYPADAVRIPQTDLPVVFRETQLSCTQWLKLIGYK